MGKLLVNLVEVLVCLSLLAVGLGWLGRWHYLADLASHFRVPATVTMLTGGLLLHWCRRLFWARAGLVGGIVCTATLLPYALPGPRAADISSLNLDRPLRLMTVNLLKTNRQHARTIEQVRAAAPDIVVFLEVNRRWLEQLQAALGPDWPYQQRRPRDDNFGIAMFSRIPWSSCAVVDYSPATGIDAIDARFARHNVRVIATHPLPPTNHFAWYDRNQTFAAIARDIESTPWKTLVVGDLNCTPWSFWFGKLLKDAGLRDSGRGFGVRSTWFPLPKVPIGLPIDHVLVSADVRVVGRMVGHDVGSDHRAVCVDVE